MNRIKPILRLLVGVAVIGLTGCIGMAPNFSSPADESEVSYTVVPVTANLVGRMSTVKAQLASEQKADISAGAATLQTKRDEPYRIGPNDVLSLDIFGLPEKVSSGTGTNIYVVQEDGTVIMPYAGTVKVADLTLAAARERIMTGMKRYIDAPQFNFRILEYRSRRLLVAGEVAKPGYQFVTAEPLTLVDVITAASGPTTEADLSTVVVQRGDKKVTVNLTSAYQSGDLSQIPRMQDGDVIRVGKRVHERVYISGAVASSSVQEIASGQTMLSDVLMKAGGIQQQSANASRIYLIRGTPANATVYHLNASSPEALVLASSFPMEPQDVVFVTESEIVRFGRILALLLQPAGNAITLGASTQRLGSSSGQ